MSMIGDYAEFGRRKGSKDKVRRKRRSYAGAAAASLTGGAALGVGVTSVVRERAYQDYARPAIRQVEREYRQSTGKKFGRKKRAAVNKLTRQSFRDLKTSQAGWGGAAEELTYEVGRRKKSPFPKMPWQYAKGRPFIISNAPVKRPIGQAIRQAAIAKPIRTGSLGGLAVGAVGYGLYRATRPRDRR